MQKVVRKPRWQRNCGGARAGRQVNPGAVRAAGNVGRYRLLSTHGRQVHGAARTGRSGMQRQMAYTVAKRRWVKNQANARYEENPHGSAQV